MTPETETEAQLSRPSVEDHLALLDLWSRYCMTMDRGDVDGYVQLFTPDAVYTVFGREFVGHDGVRELLNGVPPGLHLGGVPVIEMLDDGRARTRHNLLHVPGGDQPDERGFTPDVKEPKRVVYDGEMHKTVDGWRIARWHCRFIGPAGIQDHP
jgi:hypothetical protein